MPTHGDSLKFGVVLCKQCNEVIDEIDAYKVTILYSLCDGCEVHEPIESNTISQVK